MRESKSQIPEPVLMCWSGGKDSALALSTILEDPSLKVEALLTTVTESYERISMHGVRLSLLKGQANSLNIPLEQVRISPGASNEAYEGAMYAALQRYKQCGVSRVVFGDLFLQDIRAYREESLERLDMTGLFPLWLSDTRKLALDFIDLGFRAVLVCIDPRQMDPSFCGREFDGQLLRDLPAGVDPCGENGEFHTFVYDGPLFQRALRVRRGEVVEREGFWFCDLIEELDTLPTRSKGSTQ